MDPADAVPAVDETRPHGPDALPRTAFADRVDAWILRIGEAASWLWLVLLVVIVANVVLRYLFGEGRVELEELQWHLYAVGFLTALALAVTTDDHVRVDVVHERLSPRRRAWIELYGTVLLLYPFLALVLVYAGPFVAAAWRTDEVSQAPGGLSLRWAIKAALPAAFALLALAAAARLSRVTALLFGWPAPRPPRDEDRAGAG